MRMGYRQMRKSIASAVIGLLVVAGVVVGGPANAFSGAPTSPAILSVGTAGIVPAAWCTSDTRFRLNGYTHEWGRMPTLGTSKSCELSSGLKNGAVYSLQSTLNRCYGKKLTQDSDFGPATRTALQQVQAALGLVADGVYGVNTRAAMSFTTSLPLACVKANQISNTVIPV